MIKNIIFDPGNVLVNFRWRAFLKDKGFDEKMIETLAPVTVNSPTWKEFDRGVWSDEEVIESFVKTAPDLKTEIHKAFDDMTGIVRRYDYSIDWVKKIMAAGYNVYFLSNYSEKVRAQNPDATAFTSELTGGVWSDLVNMIKPDEDIYLKLLDTYELNPDECLFFDDTQKNVDTANRLGIHAFLFTDKASAEAVLRDCGVSY
ncbi:MAG: HAD family phosphatase [Lachnospiraceae bacterium]|nr:HAD family phosphatase [Lachnospiraceae bacterium]